MFVITIIMIAIMIVLIVVITMCALAVTRIPEWYLRAPMSQALAELEPPRPGYFGRGPRTLRRGSSVF